MCGITGFISKQEFDIKETIGSMVSSLKHRGPDANDCWIDESSRAALGHTRLSILDLTDAGSQPMISASGRFVIVFNGEIYNHISLRNEINVKDKVNWVGHSDTETLLKAVEEWGLKTTLDKSIGMFAFALWDCVEKTLTLARDRMGEKPLYYGWVNNNFVFGSELKPIKSFPGFSNKIDRNVLALFMRYSAIPQPYCIYENMYKLEAGCYLIYHTRQDKLDIKKYYSLVDIANTKQNSCVLQDDKQVIDKLETLLMDAVGLQMLSDVPVGAFLSGGVDSSTVAALMQAQSRGKANTFSIGFDVKKYNEAEHARTVAQHLGTNHHDLYVTGKDAINVIPSLPKIYDEPFADSSQIPTYLVSKIAKEKVTVCLTGDAGDELFCGYTRYHLANIGWNRLSKFPKLIRTLIGAGVMTLPYGFWHTSLLPLRMFSGKEDATDKFLRASQLLNSINRRDFYHKGFMSQNQNAESWILGADKLETFFDTNSLKMDSFYEEMMALDLITYLPNDNLVKVDRAAMAVSLETRAPLLDHRIVEFALSLPMKFKLRNGKDKWILREVLYKHVPQKLIERPKMGFAVPLEQWLRGPLVDWAENLLDEKRLTEEGFFNVSVVRHKWNEHLSGKRSWYYQLWPVLIFQAWLEEQKNLK